MGTLLQANTLITPPAAAAKKAKRLRSAQAGHAHAAGPASLRTRLSLHHNGHCNVYGARIHDSQLFELTAVDCERGDVGPHARQATGEQCGTNNVAVVNAPSSEPLYGQNPQHWPVQTTCQHLSCWRPNTPSRRRWRYLPDGASCMASDNKRADTQPAHAANDCDISLVPVKMAGKRGGNRGVVCAEPVGRRSASWFGGNGKPVRLAVLPGCSIAAPACIVEAPPARTACLSPVIMPQSTPEPRFYKGFRSKLDSGGALDDKGRDGVSFSVTNCRFISGQTSVLTQQGL